MSRPKPWDRQPGESDPAWAAFVVYRDLGLERSTAKVRENTGKNRRLIEGWSSKNSWVVRVQAWDAEQDKQWQRDLAAERRKAARRNIEISGQMKDLAVAGIGHLTEAPEKLKAVDVSRLVEVATKVEALSTGGPTEITGAAADDSGHGTLSAEQIDMLTDEDRLSRMIQLQREVETRIGIMTGTQVAS